MAPLMKTIGHFKNKENAKIYTVHGDRTFLLALSLTNQAVLLYTTLQAAASDHPIVGFQLQIGQNGENVPVPCIYIAKNQDINRLVASRNMNDIPHLFACTLIRQCLQ